MVLMAIRFLPYIAVSQDCQPTLYTVIDMPLTAPDRSQTRLYDEYQRFKRKADVENRVYCRCWTGSHRHWLMQGARAA